jgi:hypothetical protein
MLKGVKYLINTSVKWISLKKPGSKNDELIVVWEKTVQPLTEFQRLVLLSLTIIITTIAVVGNLLVLYVNFTRFVSNVFNAMRL